MSCNMNSKNNTELPKQNSEKEYEYISIVI